MTQGIPEQALRQFNEAFASSPYIGRVQIYDKEETGAGPHKFYYLGFHDIFGVVMPVPSKRPELQGRREMQIWPRKWVERRMPKLDKAVARAMEGDFIDCRHNAILKERAIKHGTEFWKKPVWKNPPPVTEEKTQLPVRGRKQKRTRRKLRQRRQLNI